MRRTNRRELNLNQNSPREYDLNKSSTSCASCLNEALKIRRKINKRILSEIKIEEIKEIVNSLFDDKK